MNGRCRATARAFLSEEDRGRPGRLIRGRQHAAKRKRTNGWWSVAFQNTTFSVWTQCEASGLQGPFFCLP